MEVLAARGICWGNRNGSEYLRAVERKETKKTMAPVSAYALEAVRDLDVSLPEDTGLAIICGPTGTLVDAFDRAWKKSSDGRLTGTDFGTSRYRRIHPFTLIPSLQNQVAATLSMELGLTGPCMNGISSETGLAYMLPSIRAMLTRTPLVLLVLASAGCRGEEALKLKAMGREDGCEGAAAFLLGREGGRGVLCSEEASSEPRVGTPILGAAFELVEAFEEGREKRVTLVDGDHGATINYQPKEES